MTLNEQNQLIIETDSSITLKEFINGKTYYLDDSFFTSYGNELVSFRFKYNKNPFEISPHTLTNHFPNKFIGKEDFVERIASLLDNYYLEKEDKPCNIEEITLFTDKLINQCDKVLSYNLLKQNKNLLKETINKMSIILQFK